MRVLVFGASGFVGSRFIDKAVRSGMEVVALSRRQPTQPVFGVKYLSVDATDASAIKNALDKEGKFDACVHAIGLLFDGPSKLRNLNVFASGSGSQPAETATYDLITRQTAFNAVDFFRSSKQAQQSMPPFIFISAAEAGWTFKAPVNFLERYLIAKRQVEAKLLQEGEENNIIRPIIFRPSLIWTKERPQGLLGVLPFYLGYNIGLPFVDRPVTVDALTDAMVTAIKQNDVNGVQRFPQIDVLAAAAAAASR
jgi:nucleoside-diphosphate-sugar epimerase